MALFFHFGGGAGDGKVIGLFEEFHRLREARLNKLTGWVVASPAERGTNWAESFSH